MSQKSRKKKTNMKTKLVKLMCAAAGVCMVASTASAAFIAYDNAAGLSGLQNWGNSLGLTFTVKQPIYITALGAFDNGDVANLAGVDPAYGGVGVGIYTSAGTLVTPLVMFTAITAVTQVHGDAFQNIAPTELSPGSYVVVAYNDKNYNSQGVDPNLTSTMNTGGGLILFTKPPQYGYGYSFPTIIDTWAPIGPANRYDAGTFMAVPEATTMIAGALLLLPFGASTLRMLRKSRKA